MYYCKDTSEIVNNYQEYLKTEHWTNLKIRFKASKLYKDGKCHLCKSKTMINIHHKSYKRIGNERLNDLIVLCNLCHSKLHKAYNNKVSTHHTLWSMTRHMNCKQK